MKPKILAGVITSCLLGLLSNSTLQAQTPTETPTPTPTDMPTATATMPPCCAPTPTPTLTAGQPFTLDISLTEDITTPFDFYLLAETPAGVYTIYLNGSLKKGIYALYRNVGRFNAPFSMTVRSAVTIPLSMKGETVTFYIVVIKAGKKPPVRKLSDLTPNTQYVIMMDKKTVTVAQ